MTRINFSKTLSATTRQASFTPYPFINALTIYRFDGFYGIISATYLTIFDTDDDTEVLEKTDC